MNRVKKENDLQKRDDDDGSSSYLSKELVEEILLKLPTKSIPKLIVVSKLWSSIVRSKKFIDLYMKRSLTRPCFLFLFNRDDVQFYHSATQEAAAPCCYTCRLSSFPLSLIETRISSLSFNVSQPVHGFICCQDLDKVVVLNPSTGQVLVLPQVRTRRTQISRFFGYDSIRDEYKVLCMTVLQVSDEDEPVVSEEHQVFTLGVGKKKEATWRMIECKVPHCPATEGVCPKNGVVYYGAWSNSDKYGSVIVAFDVRLEEFTLVKLPLGVKINDSGSGLVSCQGKVALVNQNQSYHNKLNMWVLEDVDKPEWSKISVVVPFWDGLSGPEFFHCRGAISSDEFIFSPIYPTVRPFFIVSKEDIATRVEIEGLGDNFGFVIVLLDYAECPIFL
ncbi:hypothetical protein CARUB_v10002799mg [Capsella rubella]|uniref:F-box domain-containing protein n=1 Tax=Capsella rubella TaxID=81985 RepID=R0H7S4_9BRAS|nr:F-box/kelch-repeat protein At3g04660 [Capsella rubella]EOA19603.1 hypothetical protein CARUB_v10002799mg [Capsella rubella]